MDNKIIIELHRHIECRQLSFFIYRKQEEHYAIFAAEERGVWKELAECASAIPSFSISAEFDDQYGFVNAWENFGLRHASTKKLLKELWRRLTW